MTKICRQLLTAMVCLSLAGEALAQGGGTYSVDAGSGAQGQLGGWLPIPIQQVPQPTSGTGTVLPPLLIPPAPNATVMQRVAPDAPDLIVKAGTFKRVPNGASVKGVWAENPGFYQVRTNLSISSPGSFPTGSTHTMNTVTFRVGGRTLAQTTPFSPNPTATMGGPNTTTFRGVPPSSSFARYFHTGRRFGGPARAKVVALSDILIWGSLFGVTPPCRHPIFGGASNSNNEWCKAALVAWHPVERAVAGGAIGSAYTTTMQSSVGRYRLSVPGSAGTIAQSISVTAMTGGSYTVMNSVETVGFPWTTGVLELSQTTAQGGGEKFRITGMDDRNAAGVGTITLVAGALANRGALGFDADRRWVRYVLPEPNAVLGAAVALSLLGLCHRLAQRRRG